MAENQKLSAPTRLLLELLLTILAVFILSTFLERILFVDGGLIAYIIIGSLITLMNVILRPILHVILLPFKLFIGIIVIMATQALFLFFTEKIASQMDPSLVVLHVDQGFGGWILAASILGLAHWVIKTILK